MKQSLTLGKVTKFIGLVGFLETLKDVFTGNLDKEDFKNFLRKVIMPLASVFLFFGVWYMGSKSLHDIEAKRLIDKALVEQGPAESEKVRACIDSGEKTCQPNSLPSPAQVWGAYQTLIADHYVISADKKAFIEKTAALNATRVANGEAAITYTGRPSFVDQIFTSIITVFAGFLLALIIAVPTGIVIGLSKTLRSS